MRNFVPTLLAAAMLSTLALMPRPAAAVDLTMYYPVAVGGPVTKVIDDMVARFEKENADIKVTAVYAGNYTDTMTKAMTAMKGGQPPQLSVLLSTDVFTLMDENAIVPMDGLVDDKAWFKEFYPAFMANGQIDGKTWSIPFQRSTIVLYWNKDAFKDAGLDPEKAPASWDEMAAMANGYGREVVIDHGTVNKQSRILLSGVARLPFSQRIEEAQIKLRAAVPLSRVIAEEVFMQAVEQQAGAARPAVTSL